MKIRSNADKNMDDFIAAGSNNPGSEKQVVSKKENVQNFTIWLPKKFHREIKLYAIVNDKLMSDVIREIIQRGAEAYQKENPDFPGWQE